MAAAVREVVPSAEVELIPGGSGNFIVTADGREYWHKRQMGDAFPDPADLAGKIGAS